jgi:hypothetical protein
LVLLSTTKESDWIALRFFLLVGSAWQEDLQTSADLLIVICHRVLHWMDMDWYVSQSIPTQTTH